MSKFLAALLEIKIETLIDAVAAIVCWIFLPAVGIALGFWISKWDWSAATTTPLAAQTPAVLIDLARKGGGMLVIVGLWGAWVYLCIGDREIRAASAMGGLLAGIAAARIYW